MQKNPPPKVAELVASPQKLSKTIQKAAEAAQAKLVETLIERASRGETLKSHEMKMLKAAQSGYGDAGPDLVPSKHQLSQRLGVSPQNVNNWLRMGAPKMINGSEYSVSQWRDWMKKNKKHVSGEKFLNEFPEVKSKKLTLEEQLLAAKAKKIENENAIEEGRMMTMDKARETLMAFLATLRQRLLPGSTGLAKQLEGKSVKQMAQDIRNFHNDLLFEIHNITEWPESVMNEIKEFMARRKNIPL